MNEFDLIKTHFVPLAAEDLDNDAAVLQVPDGMDLVVTSDTLNEGMHFWMGAPPQDIAHKALRTNLSDLAAMGADPWRYQLNIAVPPETDSSWFEAFAQALKNDQARYGIALSGGDTTTIAGPISISITAFGLVPKGKALTRSGAKAGDHIILTGPVGDAWVGLQILRDHIKTDNDAYFLDRYKKPNPAPILAPLLRDHAHAAIDVSDGFLADLDHICKASQLDAKLETHYFSDAAQTLVDQGLIQPLDLLSGGDDYVLILAVPEEKSQAFTEKAQKLGVSCHRAGSFVAGPGDIYDPGGNRMDPLGWQHFSV